VNRLTSVLRRAVAGFHAALGVGLSIEAIWVCQQSAVNLLWESGFYGIPSEHTSAVILIAILTVALSFWQITSSLVYVRGSDGAGTALLVGSILLTCLVRPPLQWVVIGVGFLVLVESVLKRLDRASSD
jgi:hypothetical protein